MNNVFIVLVHLHIFAKLEAGVLVLVDGEACYYLDQAKVPPTDGQGGRDLIQNMTRTTRSTIILSVIFFMGIVL